MFQNWKYSFQIMDLSFSKIKQHNSLEDSCKNISSLKIQFKILSFYVLLSMDFFFNCDFQTIITNYFDIAKPPTLCVWIHMDVLHGECFLFFQKIKVWWCNTMCCIKLFVGTFDVMAKVQSKYNVIISKFKSVDFM